MKIAKLYVISKLIWFPILIGNPPYSSGQQQRKQRTSASIEAKNSLKSITVVILLALIHCGQAAKFIPSAEILDMMQATQPHQQCHALQPEDMATEDKLVLSPIVFQGTIVEFRMPT